MHAQCHQEPRRDSMQLLSAYIHTHAHTEKSESEHWHLLLALVQANLLMPQNRMHICYSYDIKHFIHFFFWPKSGVILGGFNKHRHKCENDFVCFRVFEVLSSNNTSCSLALQIKLVSIYLDRKTQGYCAQSLWPAAFSQQNITHKTTNQWLVYFIPFFPEHRASLTTFCAVFMLR